MKNNLRCIKSNNVFIKFLKEYNSFFLKKQILIFVITLVIFMIAFSIGMSTIDFKAPLLNNINDLSNVKLLVYGHIFTVLLTILLAFIPFVKKLPIITVFYAYYMAFNVSNMFYIPTVNKTCLAISVIISLFSLSLDIVFSLEVSRRICEKFNDIINKKDREKQEGIQCVSNSLLMIMFILFMVLSMIDLVIIRFI